MKLSAAIAKLKRTQLNFAIAEIELGLTFATIARTTNNPKKFERNRENARRAYDEANRFLRDTSLSVGEIEQLNSKIAKLRTALEHKFIDHILAAFTVLQFIPKSERMIFRHELANALSRQSDNNVLFARRSIVVDKSRYHSR